MMTTEIIMKGVPGGMIAANGIEADKLEQFRNQEVMVKISRPRNLAFHRKFMAMLGTALDMADTEHNFEQFRAMVTAGAGYCDFTTNNRGDLVAVPKSIKFASMDDTEFERLYKDALTYICREFVIDQEQINRIVDFM